MTAHAAYSRHLLLAASLAAGALLAPGRLGAQAHQHAHGADSAHAKHHAPVARGGDSAFVELQMRGESAMGVDQYRAKHIFDALPDGGRIELQQPGADSATVGTIRAHLHDIARMFAAGDFSTPFFVHGREVPGTAVMTARRGAIRYEVRPLPEGGELRLTTSNLAALAAIREFMAFQRGDHRANGKH